MRKITKMFWLAVVFTALVFVGCASQHGIIQQSGTTNLRDGNHTDLYNFRLMQISRGGPSGTQITNNPCDVVVDLIMAGNDNRTRIWAVVATSRSCERLHGGQFTQPQAQVQQLNRGQIGYRRQQQRLEQENSLQAVETQEPATRRTPMTMQERREQRLQNQ